MGTANQYEWVQAEESPPLPPDPDYYCPVTERALHIMNRVPGTDGATAQRLALEELQQYLDEWTMPNPEYIDKYGRETINSLGKWPKPESTPAGEQG